MSRVSDVKWKGTLIAATVFVIAVVVGWFTVSPAHWLTKVDFGTVTINEKPVAADIYFGNPRSSEAEAIALIHLHGGGDYFFDFGSEKFRQAATSEYVRLPRGAWCFKAMDKGTFHEPLPPRKLNELRIAMSGGRVLVVQF